VVDCQVMIRFGSLGGSGVDLLLDIKALSSDGDVMATGIPLNTYISVLRRLVLPSPDGNPLFAYIFHTERPGPSLFCLSPPL
jgi:hypothetical protein